MNSAVGSDRAPPPGLGSRSSSRSSFSPTMCDSGISMEAAAAAANSVANGTNTFAQALTKQISSNVPSTDSFSSSHWTNAFDSTVSVTSSSKLYQMDMSGCMLIKFKKSIKTKLLVLQDSTICNLIIIHLDQQGAPLPRHFLTTLIQ